MLRGRGIPPVWEKWEVMLGAIFLSGSGNLNGSDFDHSNLFQSYKQCSVNTDHRLKSKLATRIRKTSVKLK